MQPIGESSRSCHDRTKEWSEISRGRDLEEIVAIADQFIAGIKALGETAEIKISEHCINDAKELIRTGVRWPHRRPQTE
jgi:hypothetical protein